MDRSRKVIFLTLLTFALYFVLDMLYFREVRTWLNEGIGQFGISHNLAYLLSGIPLFAGLLLLHPGKKFFSALGLNRPFLTGAVFALACTLPMYIGYAVFFKINPELSWNDILVGVLAAAFFEELYFRGFLFGQLYRYTRLGFILSVFLGALVFGLLHLYQSTDPMESLMIFLITFLGGILFAWIFVEWGYNIWVPICLHLFMNLAWELFDISENAMGNTYANIFRLFTVLLVIILTLVYKRKKRIPLEIGRKTVWLKPGNWYIQKSGQ
ncbi:lysostaphin resistance A-like protein [Zeaxanthinibacter enoshimensis]|uniref:CPBP family intramembrane glutamic endopeptidase n=1 Tax=Zeaxanthinibacter enoshimensis TaxID=392009 RepID=UPI0035668734